MFDEKTLLTIIVAAVTAIITTFARDFLKFIIKKTKNKISKIRWKNKIPQDYIHRDIITSLQLDSNLEIFGKKHKVKGLAQITQAGESLFEVYLERNGAEKWLDFDHGKISLWGKWNDSDLWGKFARKDEKPFPINLIELGQIKKIKELDVILTSCGISSEVKTLWGQWGRKHPKYPSLYYNIVVFQVKKLKHDGRTLYVCFESSAGQKVLYDVYIGIDVGSSNIHFSDHT